MLNHLHITARQWKTGLKWTLYAALFLLTMVFQTVILAKHPILGLKLNPVPLLIVCVCVREGPEGGGLFALLASLFWCLSGADYGNLSVAILPAGAILSAVLCRAVLTMRFFPTFLCCLAVSLLHDSVIFALKLLLAAGRPSYYTETILPSVLLSMILMPPVYLLVKAVHKTGGSYDL